MKLLGRILAILLAAVISVLAAQRLIKRLYNNLGKRYVSVDSDFDGTDGI